MARPDNAAEFEDIGLILAWGFSRPTTMAPTIAIDKFRDEWLLGRRNDDVKYALTAHADPADMARVLRQLYGTRANAVTVKNVVEPAFRASLENDGTGNHLVYIEKLFVPESSKLKGEDAVDVSPPLNDSAQYRRQVPPLLSLLSAHRTQLRSKGPRYALQAPAGRSSASVVYTAGAGHLRAPARTDQ